MKALLTYLLLPLLVLCGCHSSKTTISTQAPSTARLVDTAVWQFIPQRALPTVGRTRQLTSDFLLRYTKEKLTVYLPYYGRATNAADAFSGKGPLDFISTQFKTTVLHPAPGKWKITLIPGDNGEVRQMDIEMYDNGRAWLNVLLNNHSSIRYDGVVEAVN